MGRTALFLMYLLVVLMAPAAKSVTADVIVSWRSVDVPEGQVLYVQLVRVSGPASGYVTLPAQKSFAFKASPLDAEFQIEDVEPGAYLLRGFLDENGDGELAKDKKGRPKEPFGFSHSLDKRRASFRPSKAVFELREDAPARVAFSLVTKP